MTMLFTYGLAFLPCSICSGENHTVILKTIRNKICKYKVLI